MSERVVIIGGGTSGTVVANRLNMIRGQSTSITVIDRDDVHRYQPRLLPVAFGLADPDAGVRPRHAQLRDGIEFRVAEADRIEAARNTVVLKGGEELSYDVLVVASGAYLLPDETEGLTGPGWLQRMFTFYTHEGAVGLRDALARFSRGRIVLNIVDMPIKCSVAPLEFCYLADWYYRRKGLRDKIEITYVTPLEGAFTKPLASRYFADSLRRRGVSIETEFNAARVDGETGRLLSWEGREVSFDLLVSIPLHGGADFVERSSGLGDDAGFVLTDPRTLRANAAPNIFAIGDAANLPTAKTGSAAHYQTETVVTNIWRFLDGRNLEASYDGHSTCFIETGFGKASLIDFNYDLEPFPGRYPLPVLGPFTLLGESRANHLGKSVFELMYWHLLLPGRGVPGTSGSLSTMGKRIPADRLPPKAKVHTAG
jgi:sulfide:quinone oxidoreductase